MIDNNKKAVIHIAKSQTGMTEEEYRALLSSVGVESSKDLTPESFKKLMKHFEKIGFNGRGTKHRAPVSSKARLAGKIKAMLAGMDLTEAYADGIAKRMFSTDKYIWCDADQLRKITAALMYKKRRSPVKDSQKENEKYEK